MDRSKKQLLYSNVFIKPDFISLCEQEFFFSVATGAQREGDPWSFAPPRSGTTGRPRPQSEKKKKRKKKKKKKERKKERLKIWKQFWSEIVVKGVREYEEKAEARTHGRSQYHYF